MLVLMLLPRWLLALRLATLWLLTLWLLLLPGCRALTAEDPVVLLIFR